MLNKLSLRLKLWARSRYILAGRSILRRLGLKYVKMLEYERRLDVPIPEVVTKVPVEIKPFSAEDVSNEAFRGISLTSGEDPISHDKTLSRIANGGDVCLVATVNGEVAGYAWILLKGTNYEPALEREERFAEDEGLVYQLHVFPMFRGLGIASKLNEKGLQLLKTKGYQKAWSYVEADNIPSIKSFERVGFCPAKIITCLRIFMFRKISEQAINRTYSKVRTTC